MLQFILSLIGGLLILLLVALLLIPFFTCKPRIKDEGKLYIPPWDEVSFLGSFVGYMFTGHALQVWSTKEDAMLCQKRWMEEAQRRGKLGIAWRMMCFHWAIIPASPRDAHHVLIRSSFYQKPEYIYRDILTPLLGHSIINLPNGDVHQRVRRVLGPAFAKSHAERVYGDEGFFSKHITDLMDQIDAASSKASKEENNNSNNNSGAIVEYRALVEEMTTNVISDLMYNRESGAGANLVTCFQQLAGYFLKGHMELLAIPPKVRPLLALFSSRFRELYAGVAGATAEIRRGVVEIVEGAKLRPPPEHDKSLIDLMAEAQKSGSMTSEEAGDAALQISFAGSETTAGTMFWMLHYLSKNPEVQQQVFEELQDVVQRRVVPIFSDVADLPMLDSALRETMRLVPAVTSICRYAQKDDVLPSGLSVKGGEEVVISFITLQTMESIWGNDALQFKPARWLTEKVKTMIANPDQHGLVHAPFSAGTRDCLGKYVAVCEMKQTIAALVRTYKISVAAGQPEPIKTQAFTTRPSYTPKLRFEPRSA